MNKTLFIQFFVIISIVLAYFFIDFNEVYNSLRGETKFITQDKSCDLHKSSCEITIDKDNTFTLEVFPKEIPLMKQLSFKVTSSNENLNNAILRIYATNMFMGYYDLKLQAVEKGVYEVKGTLPTCPVGNMKWNADLELNRINERVGARFQFQTTR